MYIKNLNEIGKDDVMTAGGKGANLGELVQAGLPVPEGFVITAEAYRYFIENSGLKKKMEELLKGDLFSAAALIREDILHTEFPDDLENEIREAYHRMNDESSCMRAAVRSSATAEDLPDASFAGQQETYLNVIGEEELIDSVRKCYASLWGERAVSYRKSQGYDQLSVSLAAVVQKMVESEKAGVLFTANPLTGNCEEMTINASYGLGEAVVSGQVTPDSYVCTGDGAVKSFTIGSKEIQIVYSNDNGTVKVDVPEEMQKARALSNHEVRMLCEEAEKIETHYGSPMDIEWAIADGRVYMLQARAITTLKEKISEDLIAAYASRNKVSAFANKNLIFTLEKIPDADLPFDYDMMNAINGQREVLLEEIGIKMDMHPQIDDNGISILPAGKVSINKNILKLPAILKEFEDADYCLQKLDEHIPHLEKRLEDIRTVDVQSLDCLQCAEWIKTIDTYVRELAYERFHYALFPNVMIGRSVNKALHKVDRNLTQYDILANLEYKTAVVNADIAKLAEKAKSIPGCAEAIQSRMPYKEIYGKYPALAEMLDRFMSEHGYKSDFNCYCIKAKTFLEDPDRVFRIMTPLLNETGTPKEDKSYNALLEKIQGTYSGRKYEELKHQIEALRSFHVYRESTQYMWEEAFYHLRSILERASYLLTGDSDVSRSLAYLFMQEAIEVCKEGRINDSIGEKISRRIEKRPLAEAVWERSKALAFTKNKNSTSDVLKGAPASAGVTVGKVCIVHDSSEFYKMEKGMVLVCPYTDPEWTPLFLLASAVVADTGAELSHAAIVAREYGIPAVLGVGFATTLYKDGDLVKVDGDRGEVTKP